MKCVMITFDQASYENVIEALDRSNCRGFSMCRQVEGRGSKTGEPHFGSHAWPSMWLKILKSIRCLNDCIKSTRTTKCSD